MWGPRPISVDRQKYYVSFIDDFSKFCWIYFLKNMSDVFAKFHLFQQHVERLFDHEILAMQKDWGGEYQKLHSFLDRMGITHHVSCPHAHQQNGSAGKKHRHIVEVGLSLLAHAYMPLKFWDEAFLTAVYLINHVPSRVINNQTPLERLFGTKPNYTFLRIFGCAVWPNLHPFNKHKLEFRSKQCIFLGYSSLHKGYKCLDVATGRVYFSRDVVFDEQVFPFAKLHPNAGAQLRKELVLLPAHLLPSPNFIPGGVVDPADHVSMSHDSIDQNSAESVQEYNEAFGENSYDFMSGSKTTAHAAEDPDGDSGADLGGIPSGSASSGAPGRPGESPLGSASVSARWPAPVAGFGGPGAHGTGRPLSHLRVTSVSRPGGRSARGSGRLPPNQPLETNPDAPSGRFGEAGVLIC